ncbi:hypothetical protein [Trichloromonas sp.]|uniref:hypothetical protein n=1 Tax=Trichloromonas sp. TaxID=3069249 RepID=UPI002A483500|nr:hypothetical protein [Trichloromonas sp.]
MTESVLKDFPAWFLGFAEGQLAGYLHFGAAHHDETIEQLQIAYIKIWSVVEIFSKIIIILADKRTTTKELKPLVENIKRHREKLDEYEKGLIEIISFHESSINDSETNQFKINDVANLKIDLKKISSKKFSVSKSDVFKPALPKKNDLDKAIKVLNIDPPKFSDFLNAADKESKFYTTRNKIAHEGTVDLKKENFIKERLLPILQISLSIRDFASNMSEEQ